MIKENKNSIRIGKAIIGLYFIILIISIFWTPYDPNKVDTSMKLLSPSLAHPFGTDNMGRDILSRLMEGSQYALILSFGTVSLALFLGSIIGASAGYFGGAIDEVLMRFIDSLMAFPGIWSWGYEYHPCHRNYVSAIFCKGSKEWIFAG